MNKIRFGTLTYVIQHENRILKITPNSQTLLIIHDNIHTKNKQHIENTIQMIAAKIKPMLNRAKMQFGFVIESIEPP